MEHCPVCSEQRRSEQCAGCRYDFAQHDPQRAIAHLERRLGHARLLWLAGLLSVLLWPIPIVFGSDLVVLLVFGATGAILFGVHAASHAKRQLAAAQALLPQLPAARVVHR